MPPCPRPAIRKSQAILFADDLQHRLGSGLKKYSRPTLNTMAMRNSVGSVGCITSRSSLESSAGERPVCLLNSSKPHALSQPQPP